MEKHVVFWKPVRRINRQGKPFTSDSFPMLVEVAYKGRLLSAIMNMPKKKPITFEHAVNLVELEYNRAVVAGNCGPNPGQANWFYRNFVEWISEQGYSIELTGDEFETPTLSRLVA